MGEPEQEAQGRRSFYTIRRTVLSGVLLIFLLCTLLGGWVYHFSRQQGPPGPETVVIQVPPGLSFDKITDILVAGGLVHDDIRFKIIAHLEGLSSKLRAGEFELETGMRPVQVLKALSTAKSLQHKLTIAEGLNTSEIAALLEKKGWADSREFLRLVHDSQFIADMGLGSSASLEGYLFPDTYYLTRIPKLSTRQIAEMMVQRFRDVWKSLEADTADIHEAVILASIVEKETAEPSERPVIASVFLNRLKKGMRLQSDPTVIYGLDNFDGNLTRKDLQSPSPYNTYTLPGLPKGPICSPGKDAIASVLRPANEDYLYFVSKNDGTHYFSKSLREHNRAVRKYQRKMK